MTNAVKGNPTAHGTVGGTAVTSSVDSDGLASKLYVTLGANYARVIPPGYPDPNPGSDPAKSKTSTPQTIPNGARVQFFKHEANAIVAAGGGALS